MKKLLIFLANKQTFFIRKILLFTTFEMTSLKTKNKLLYQGSKNALTLVLKNNCKYQYM